MKCESLLFKLCLVSDNNKPIIPALDVPVRVINKQWSPKKHMQYWFLSFPFPFGQGVQLNALPQLQWEYQMLSVLHVSRLKWSINSLTWCERDKENILKENLGGFFFFLSQWLARLLEHLWDYITPEDKTFNMARSSLLISYSLENMNQCSIWK